MTRSAAALLVLAALLAAGAAPVETGSVPFEGTWSASGRRDTLATEEGRTAAIIRLSGALVLTRGEGLGGGFHAEVIGFDDGRSVRIGRAAWTDERGDRIFSRLEGEEIATGRRVLGTITGGTGRYEGIAGAYALTWQYVVRTDDGTIQGRTVSLEGWYRPRATAP